MPPRDRAAGRTAGAHHGVPEAVAGADESRRRSARRRAAPWRASRSTRSDARYHGITARHAVQPAETTGRLRGEPAADDAVDPVGADHAGRLPTGRAVADRGAPRRRASGRSGRRCRCGCRYRVAEPGHERVVQVFAVHDDRRRLRRRVDILGPHQPAAVGAPDAPVGHRARDRVQAGTDAEPVQRGDTDRARSAARRCRARSRSLRSSSVTCQSARASAPATARPPIPAPTTTAEPIRPGLLRRGARLRRPRRGPPSRRASSASESSASGSVGRSLVSRTSAPDGAIGRRRRHRRDGSSGFARTPLSVPSAS